MTATTSSIAADSDTSGATLIVSGRVSDSLGRPGLLRRIAAGAWHVPGGLAFLLRRPRLWPLALLPAVLAAALLCGGLVLALFALGPVESALAPAPGQAPEWLRFLLTLAIWLATLTAGIVLGFALALALAAPVLDQLSRRVEALILGTVTDATRGLGWEAAQSLRSGLYFVLRAPGIFLLGLVPLAGPALAALWGAHALALQQTEGPLTRRGLDFRARRDWLREWRPESLGFGLAGLVVLLVPLANFCLAPALAVGATRLVLELDEEARGEARAPETVPAALEAQTGPTVPAG
jgi:CysZ protein